MAWYAVYTEPRQEYRAHHGLLAAGFESLYLHYGVTVSHARRKIAVLKPLFERYLFASAEPAGLHDIAETHGVVGLVGTREGAITVPDAVIADLRSRADTFGRVKPPDTFHPRKPYAPGDRLQITSGAWLGYDFPCLVDDGGRILLLVNALGRQIVASFAPEAVKPFTQSAGR
jgi:transcriptional antiterminator RfaH